MTANFTISESMVSTVAIIAVLIGPLHVGVPLGSNLIYEELQHFFQMIAGSVNVPSIILLYLRWARLLVCLIIPTCEVIYDISLNSIESE